MIFHENIVRDNFKNCIPILVGITGHRDVENENELMNNIEMILLEICEKYKSSPIVLLTPLAEGADRIAAKALIKLSNRYSNRLSYMVILPMNEVDYKKTFTSDVSVSEYEQLKRTSIGSYVVPVEESLSLNGISDFEIKTSRLYANMGAYIALNTQILIAAWNGAEERLFVNNGKKQDVCKRNFCASDGSRCSKLEIKHGGTYHILRMRFFGIEDSYRGNSTFLDNREFGPVYWIKTKRKSTDYLANGQMIEGPIFPEYPIDFSSYDIKNSPDGYNLACRKLVSDEFLVEQNDEKKVYNILLSKLDTYNHNVINMTNKQFMNSKKAHDELLGVTDKNDKENSSHLFSKHDLEFTEYYSIANELSLYFQKKRKIDVWTLVLLAFIGLLSFNLYSGPLVNSWFITLYSIIYLLGSIYYITHIQKNNYHEKYVNYRGIAEGLRVQFFWDFTGINKKVTEKYMTKQKNSIDWVRVAINNLTLLYRAKVRKTNNSMTKKKIDLAYKLWIQNQYEYYNRKWPLKEKIIHKQMRAEKIFFVLGLVVAIILTIFDTLEFALKSRFYINLYPILNRTDYISWHKWFVFLVGFLPVTVALLKVFTELLASAKLSRNYKWMSMVYTLADHEYHRIKINFESDLDIYLEKEKRLLYEVGIEAMLENGEWIGIFEERVPELPK